MDADERTGDRITLFAFLVMVVGIGGNVVAIKLIAREGDLEPFWAAASRFALATAIFVAAALALRAPWPRGRALLGAVLYGALSFGAFFALAYWGLQDVPASMAGVVLATAPLLTFLLAIAHGLERFRWDALAGGLIVIAGTAFIFSTGVERGVPVLSLLAILGAAAAAAEGSIVVKGFPPVHPAVRNAIGMAVGTAMLFALMPVFGESAAMPRSATTWWAQTYLVLGGTVGVFGLYLFVLARWTASAVSYEFVLAPVVAIVLAAWLLGEPVTATFLAGAALILVGVYLGAIRPRARVERAVQPGPAKPR